MHCKDAFRIDRAIAKRNIGGMETFPEVIDALSEAITADLGITPGRLAVWKHRKRIPPEFWVPVAGLTTAKERGITAEKLKAIDDLRKLGVAV